MYAYVFYYFFFEGFWAKSPLDVGCRSISLLGLRTFRKEDAARSNTPQTGGLIPGVVVTPSAFGARRNIEQTG